MTDFTAKDREFIIKLAKKIELVSTDLELLKKQLIATKQATSKKAKQLTFAGEPIPANNFEVTFSKDVDWTNEEKRTALKTLYEALRNMCQETGIVQLNIDMKVPKNDV